VPIVLIICSKPSVNLTGQEKGCWTTPQTIYWNSLEIMATNNDRQELTSFDSVQQMNATEYLAQVSKEAKSLPNVFASSTVPARKKRCIDSSNLGRSNNNNSNHDKNDDVVQNRNVTKRIIPIDGSAACMLYLTSKKASITPPPTLLHLPTLSSEEWVGGTIANFERLRSYLDKCKAQGVGGKESNRVSLPLMKDRPSWHIFCVGIDEANGNVSAYYGGTEEDDINGSIIDNDDDDDEKEDETARWQLNLPPNGYQPSVKLLLQMDQVMVRRVLSHLSYYIHLGWSVHTNRRLEWMYGLLAALEKPLHRDDAATLFSLLKDLTSIRATIDCVQDRKGLARLNVLIALIGVFFEQGGGLTGVMTFTP
jgi:survival of motor neuron protein-interacting protein 1